MFVIKKVVGTLLMPLPAFFVAIIASLLLWKLGKRKLSKCLMATAIVALYAASLPLTAFLAGSFLNSKYPYYAGQDVDAVVVLGGSHDSSYQPPLSSLLSPVSLMRLTEGVFILEQNPLSKLYLSGYAARDDISNAEAMARVAQGFGIERSKIEIAPKPQDTDDEARHWASVLQGKRVALVTSASHMPRAMYLFEQADTRPVAAPTNFVYANYDLGNWYSWIPSPNALAAVEAAWHEYLGLFWARLRN